MKAKHILIILTLIFSFSGSCGTKSGNKENSVTSAGSHEVTPAEKNTNPASEDTLSLPLTVEDIDGNVYNTLKIGKQTWMKENLKTTKFNDGTSIKLVVDKSAWESMAAPAFCWYNNEAESYKETYGALYNGFAASSSKLCPKYWHVPGDTEWNSLSKLLGGEKIAGGKLKESGYDYWINPNTGAVNEIGFSALPGGLRYYDGAFRDFGFSAYFWTSTESSQGRSWFRYMDYQYSDLFRFNNFNRIGFSVRCVRDF